MSSSIYKTHVPESGGGLFLKMRDGETLRLRLMSEPAIYQSRSDRGGKETLTTKYAWLAYNYEASAVQIIQQSATFFRNIAALAQEDEWGDPTGYDIKVKREGTELKTTYTITPSTNRDTLPYDAIKTAENINLLDKLGMSPFAEHIYWLEDFERMQEDGKHSSTAAEAEPVDDSEPSGPPDRVVTDISDTINLDDISF